MNILDIKNMEKNKLTIKQYIFDYIRRNTFVINELFQLKDNEKFSLFRRNFQNELNDVFSVWKDDGRGRHIKDNIETYWFQTKFGDNIMITRKGKEININWNPKINKL